MEKLLPLGQLTGKFPNGSLIGKLLFWNNECLPPMGAEGFKEISPLEGLMLPILHCQFSKLPASKPILGGHCAETITVWKKHNRVNSHRMPFLLDWFIIAESDTPG